MATGDSKKFYRSVSVDPNFSRPPGVIDLEYRDIDDAGESSTNTERSDETGNVISIDYDDAVIDGGYDGTVPGDGTDTQITELYPPDYISFVSQITRIASDGRVVVDVVIDVPDAPAGLTYDVRLTKP